MFAGIIIRTGHHSIHHYATNDAFTRAINSFSQADKVGYWRGGNAFIVNTVVWNTPESKYENPPYKCPYSGLVIASWLRIDNRKELCSSLSLNNANLTDPEIVIKAYIRWGEGCLNKLEGDFSFAIYDPAENTVFCARDSLGTKPFFYYLNREIFIFSSTASVFPLLEKINVKPNKKWIARYIAGLSASHINTAFESVYKLPPAHKMSISRSSINSAAELPEKYFGFRDTATKVFNRDPIWVDTYRTRFHQSVENRLRSSYLIGAESSGGLDSSGIVAHAAKTIWHGIDDFHCFGSLINEKEEDYILKTSARCGIAWTHIHRPSTFGVPDEIRERAIRQIGYPAEHSLATGHFHFYQWCERLGVRTLLSGFVGDEVTTNSAPYLHAELWSDRQYWALLKELSQHPTHVARFLLGLLRKSYLPRKVYINSSFIRGTEKASVLSADVAEHYEVFSLTEAPPISSVNQGILTLQLENPMLATRLECCTLLANSYKLEYRWPLADRTLINQYLNTPAIEKRKGSMGRYLHRRAVAGAIPDAITWKKTKHLGQQLNPWKDIAPYEKDLWESLHPIVRELVDKEKIDLARQRMLQILETKRMSDWVDIVFFARQREQILNVSHWLRYYFN